MRKLILSAALLAATAAQADSFEDGNRFIQDQLNLERMQRMERQQQEIINNQRQIMRDKMDEDLERIYRSH